MKRVLIMSTLYPPYVVGGAELCTQQIAEEMARDYEVSVITSSPDKNTHREQMNGVTVYRVPARNVGSWKRPADTKLKTALFHIGENYNFPREAQIRSIFDEVKPDLLHTNNLAWLSTQIWVHAKKQGCKIMHNIHDRRLLCPYHMFGHGLCHRRCNFCKAYNLRRDSHSKHVDQLVGVSRDVLDAHLREGLFPKAQSHVIHNGVEDLYSEPYHPTPPYKFGFLGALSKSKGIDQLLRVWASMPPENQLLIAGTSGSVASDQALKEKYALPNITFLGRVKPDEFLSEIDILVTPSNFREPFGRVVIEGFSCAIPTIASNRGGFPEIIEPDKTGWLFDCDNDDDLLQHLKKITELPTGKLEEMSQRCRERYLKNFTDEIMLNNYRQRYIKLLNS